MPVAQIKAEGYNCNIRRYLDIAPPPEPHDARAHLHGGVPMPEMDALARFWANYDGLQASCFTPRAAPEHGTLYADFTPALAPDKRAIADLVKQHLGVQHRHAQFMGEFQAWWQQHLPLVEALAPDADNHHARLHNVYELRAKLLDSIERTFAQQHLMNRFQVRGAFANFYKLLASEAERISIVTEQRPETCPI